MASEDLSHLSYPFILQWDFGERDESSAIYKTPKCHLPGFPLTYYFRMDFERVDDQYPDIAVTFCCYCDYENVEIEADFVYVMVHDDRRTHPTVKHYKVDFTNDRTKLECFNAKDCEWHYHKCSIKVQGTFLIKNLQPMPLSVRVPKSNRQLFINEIGKDFVIIAEGQEFKIHKSILQQCSTVFRAMFESSNWRETKEGKMEIPTISAKLAKIAIDCFYGKKYWRFLDKSDYISLYQFADQYDFGILKYAIQNTIILTPLNVVEYANLAAEAKAEGLIQSCIENIMICSQYSVPIKDIKNLGSDVKLLIADQMLTNPLCKRDIVAENQFKNMRMQYAQVKIPDPSTIPIETEPSPREFSPQKKKSRRGSTSSTDEDYRKNEASEDESDGSFFAINNIPPQQQLPQLDDVNFQNFVAQLLMHPPLPFQQFPQLQDPLGVFQQQYMLYMNSNSGASNS